MKNWIRREPVVVSFVQAAVALAVALGLNPGSGAVEAAMDLGTLAFAAWSMVRARSKVTPEA